METELALTLADVWTGVVAGVGIYVVVIALTRVFGQRSLASMSSFDFPVAVAIGAIVGRTALVHTTVAGGLVALITLFTIQALVGYLRNHLGLGTVVDNPPILLVHGGRLVPSGLRRAHLSREDVIEQIRLAGVCDLDQVGAVVLERSGAISVLAGHDVDPRVMVAVQGWMAAEDATDRAGQGGDG